MFNFNTKKSFLGIDIGTQSIKLVEVSLKGKTRTLENYGEVETSLASAKPFQVMEKNNINVGDQSIAKALNEIRAEAGIKTVDAGFSIPDYCSFFSNLQIPVMSEEEIPQAVQYEIRPYIPMPLSEIFLDWVITEGQPGKTAIKMLVVAIPIWVVEQYKEIARASNLKPKFLESEAFAITRAIALSETANKIIGLIDLGARSTNCAIIDNGVLKNSYSFNVAGNELTEQLARSLGVDHLSAENLKKQYGVIAGAQGREDTRKILIPMVDSVVGEVKKAFRNFYSNEGKEIDKIVLSGGMAFLPGLKEYFFVELKKETAIANPFANFYYPPQLKDVLEKKGPSFVVSTGLALKGLM
jgi:type IV pilus assembly protein PilM